MITAAAVGHDGVPVLIIGLNRNDQAKLALGGNLLVPEIDFSALRGADTTKPEIVIFGAPTDIDLTLQLTKLGLVDDGTDVRDPRSELTGGPVPDTVDQMFGDGPRGDGQRLREP